MFSRLSSRLPTLLIAGLITVSLSAPSGAFAQEDEEPARGIPENGIMSDLSLGVIGIAYEHTLGEYFSLNLAAQFYSPWYETDGVYGAGGELRLFFFPGGTAPEGWYVAVGGRGAWVVATEGTEGQREGYAISFRFAAGYSFLVDAFLLRLGVGGQYQFLDVTDPMVPPPLSEDFENMAPLVDIYVGAVF